MAACDVIVHASTQPEPFGGVIVEAMLTGQPVIASDAGGAKEIVIDGETGFLTPTGDDKALSKAIEYCLQNSENSKNMAKNARKRAIEYFSNETMVNEFKALLKKIS
jgi:glycosyltransferase involved in cell wall biosynthesis